MSAATSSQSATHRSVSQSCDLSSHSSPAVVVKLFPLPPPLHQFLEIVSYNYSSNSVKLFKPLTFVTFTVKLCSGFRFRLLAVAREFAGEVQTRAKLTPFMNRMKVADAV